MRVGTDWNSGESALHCLHVMCGGAGCGEWRHAQYRVVCDCRDDYDVYLPRMDWVAVHESIH